ncbi:MAG TPA: molybdate ABC transporter substrate-binding protein, partial [Herpetosiphonaceae bacterium]|nr:molybdate ABC transporter substrate-binding protein [Herpetosiphonaceae bacterium]
MARPSYSAGIALILLLLAACGSRPLGAVRSIRSTTTDVPTVVSTSAPGETTSVPAAGDAELFIFAAASLTDAFRQLGANFQQAHPGTTVTFNFAGSQQLAQQIAQGAPADVFAPASTKQMDALVQSGQVNGGTSQVLARNRLIVIYPEGNPAGLATLQDLAKPDVKLVLAAKEVPAGQYALDFFDKAAADSAFGDSFRAHALQNVVSYEENVRAVLTKLTLGEADAGIVYASDIRGAAGAKVGRIEI